MKKVIRVKSNEVEIKTFVMDDFIDTEKNCFDTKKVTRKELKMIADDLGLTYDDKAIIFSKKLINRYLAKKGE